MKRILAILALALAPLLPAATTISQYGITWTWQEDRPIGQFANGDYYVVGQITLTGISPASVPATINGVSRIVNGSMINPISGSYPENGLDSRLINYVEALNIARVAGSPLSPSNTRVVSTGSSIYSTISKQITNDHEFFSDAAVLTVLASAPAAGSFRPPYIGSNKTITHNKSELNYSILKRLTVPGMTSPPSGDQFARVWCEISTDYNLARDYRPTNNQKSYDRDIGFDVQRAMLELHLDYDNSVKELPYIRLVQYAMDLTAAMKYGEDWVGGTKYSPQYLSTFGQPPAVMGALALNDTEMKFYANDANRVANPYRSGGAIHHRWSLNGAITYVNSGHVNAVMTDQYLDPLLGGRMRLTYTTQMIGTPEFLFEWEEISTGTGSNWSNDYRDVRFMGFIGQWLALQLTTGAKALVNWPATFDYMDRAYAIFTTRTIGVDPTENYIKAFWAAHRSAGATIWTETSPVSGIGWISEDGLVLTIEYMGVVTAGAGGNGGVTLTAPGGAVTATYAGGNGSTQRWYNLSRPILPSEYLLKYSYTQPGNGVETLSGIDVPSVTNVAVVNYRASPKELGGGGGRSLSSDTTPPTPNPSTFANPPTKTSNSISATATTSTDISVPVTYRFSSNNGSTWTSYQSSPSYTFTGLTPSTNYQIRVQAQDSVGNSTTQSSPVSVTTDAGAVVAPSNPRIRVYFPVSN